MDDGHLGSIKQNILRSLAHPEAEDGLYFRNFICLHEEDERPSVSGTQVEILDALQELLRDGQVDMDESGPEVIFFLKKQQQH